MSTYNLVCLHILIMCFLVPNSDTLCLASLNWKHMIVVASVLNLISLSLGKTWVVYFNGRNVLLELCWIKTKTAIHAASWVLFFMLNDIWVVNSIKGACTDCNYMLVIFFCCRFLNVLKIVLWMLKMMGDLSAAKSSNLLHCVLATNH